MSEAYSYGKGVSGFDQTFGVPMRQFIPTLIRLAHLALGQQVLDVATGTGVAAEAAMAIIGASGHMTAVDNSLPMLDEAKKRLNAFPNVSFGLEDGQALNYPNANFDAVLCSMSLHVFSDPQRALSGFYRVLREGGIAVASVNTTPERSLTGHLRSLIAQREPSKRPEIAAWHAHHFALGDPDRLRRPFEIAGFRDVETVVETRRFSFPSFDAYFNPIAEGGGPWGEEYTALSVDVRRMVRDDLRQEMEGGVGTDGSVAIDVNILFASGRK